MDTLTLQRPAFDKVATSVAGISIAFCLIIAQTLLISANDFDVGITGVSPRLDYIRDKQLKEEQFNNEIKSKYYGAKIYDIDSGIKHIKMVRLYGNRPVRLNIVELSTEVNSNLELEPVIASSENLLASRTKIKNIAQRNDAIVAINGGYFKPQTGVPLGTLMINGKVYTGPIYDRVAMGFFNNKYEMARVQLRANIETNIGDLQIDNINQPRMLSTHKIVYTPSWGELSPPTPKYGKQLVVENNRIKQISTERCKIPANGYVIVGPAKEIDKISNARRIKFNVKMNPEWKNVNHIISGGPYLIKNGSIYIDMTAQKLVAIGGRNPRTAIGYTSNNHVIMLTADGREGSSIGLTLNELASIMKELGCINAMNLDGGGATVMYVNGQVVNKPPIEGGIPLSHTLTVHRKNIS